MVVKRPKSAQPTTFPMATTRIVSTRLRPKIGPRVPSTQLIGARFAPIHTQNCWSGVESRSATGTGSIPCASRRTASESSRRSWSMMDMLLLPRLSPLRFCDAGRMSASTKNALSAQTCANCHGLGALLGLAQDLVLVADQDPALAQEPAARAHHRVDVLRLHAGDERGDGVVNGRHVGRARVDEHEVGRLAGLERAELVGEPESPRALACGHREGGARVEGGGIEAKPLLEER